MDPLLIAVIVAAVVKIMKISQLVILALVDKEHANET